MKSLRVVVGIDVDHDGVTVFECIHRVKVEERLRFVHADNLICGALSVPK
jgi:hypothetical protein